SPPPTAAAAGETSSAAATCRAQLARTPSAPPGAAPASTGAWLEVATDVRGPFTLVVFESGGRTATCLSSSSMTLVSVNSAVGSSGRTESVAGVVVGRGGGVTGAASPGGGISTNSTRHLVPGAGAGIVSLSVTHLTSPAQGAYSVAVGAVQPGVGGVTLGLADGQRVEGTVGNGWLLAWWPGASDATSAQVVSASGTTTEPLGSTPPPAAGTPGGGGTTAATGNSGSPATGDS
ncbi:MAG TPA: hypothetical protein VMB72_00880, partial [Acidimicrobiales bacterium]|nr:hypothetical protein [Acidimicrobiales bacterium]